MPTSRSRQIRHLRHLRRGPLLAACAALTLVACTGNGAETASPTAEPPTATQAPPGEDAQATTGPPTTSPPGLPVDDAVRRDWPQLPRVEATDLAGFGTATVSDEDIFLHLVVPELEEHPVLSDRLAQAAEERAEQYRQDFETQDVDPVGRPYLSSQWQVVGASEEILGVAIKAVRHTRGALRRRGRSTGTHRIRGRWSTRWTC
ncbi:hypothetical protein ACQBAT_03915 [Ornithinimicrobium sp. Y1847]|uniref:hypothetical protein n=1 Tax=Ornithinimicrobium sp. Y1847 TaxID=3405419 RepID=UPI003B67B70F